MGFSTLDIDKFKESFIASYNFENCRNLALKGDAVGNGSRTFTWRLFLGVIPEDGDLSKWVQAIRKVRADYYKKTEDLRIVKDKELDPRFFNPLASATENNPWNNLFKDKDVRELIV